MKKLDLILLSSLGILLVVLGLLAISLGTGVMATLSNGRFVVADFSYKANLLTFGSDVDGYSESGALVLKVGYFGLLIGGFLYVLTLSLVFTDKLDKAYYLFIGSSLLAFLGGVMFFFGLSAVPVNEGYQLYLGEGFILPSAFGIICASLPGVEYLKRNYLDKLKESANG